MIVVCKIIHIYDTRTLEGCQSPISGVGGPKVVHTRLPVTSPITIQISPAAIRGFLQLSPDLSGRCRGSVIKCPLIRSRCLLGTVIVLISTPVSQCSLLCFYKRFLFHFFLVKVSHSWNLFGSDRDRCNPPNPLDYCIPRQKLWRLFVLFGYKLLFPLISLILGGQGPVTRVFSQSLAKEWWPKVK